MKQNNEKGYVLLITIFTLVLISVLGLSLMTVSSNSIKTSSNERASQSVFYLAEAGINYKQAILLEEIQQIYTQEKNNPANKTGTTDKFETTFTQRVKTLLDQNANTSLDETYFIDQSNGKPQVQITVTQNGSPRNFTITSTGKYQHQTSSRTVQRNFEIDNNLLTMNPYEVPISGSTPPSSEPTIEKNNPVKDFRKITAQASIDEAKFNGVLSFQQNAKFKTAMPYSKRGEIHNIGVRSLFDFGVNLSPKPTTPAVVIPNRNTTSSASGTLPTNGGNITLTSSMNMPKFNNFTNRVFNIHIPSGEHSIYFTDNFLNYNLASVRFNVTGGGILNIVFEKHYELNSNRKFIIDAPNTEVNTIFKSSSTIIGEFVAQNIYVHNRFEPTSSLTSYAKVIVDDIYLNGGILDKDGYSTVSARNIYGKNSRVIVVNPTLFNSYVLFADNITLEGNINDNTKYGALHLDSGGEVVVKDKIFVKNANLTLWESSCLQAELIVVPHNETHFKGHINYTNYYGKKLIMNVSGETNNKLCGNGNSKISISPTVPNDTPQTKTEYEYLFKDNNYIDIHNLIEVNL